MSDLLMFYSILYLRSIYIIIVVIVNIFGENIIIMVIQCIWR